MPPNLKAASVNRVGRVVQEPGGSAERHHEVVHNLGTEDVAVVAAEGPDGKWGNQWQPDWTVRDADTIILRVSDEIDPSEVPPKVLLLG